MVRMFIMLLNDDRVFMHIFHAEFHRMYYIYSYIQNNTSVIVQCNCTLRTKVFLLRRISIETFYFNIPLFLFNFY
jgi:hypothetical protein